MKGVLLLGWAALLATGCASGSGLPPEAEQAIKTYYQAHASEKNGRCSAPYIDGFTQVAIVEDGPKQQVVDVRYLYRDRFKNDGGEGERRCIGYDDRRFTLGKSEAGLQVVEMTGPTRR